SMLSVHLVSLRPPTSPLFPYTTLFRSLRMAAGWLSAWIVAVPAPSQSAPIPIALAPSSVSSPATVPPGAGSAERGVPQGTERSRSEEHTSELQSPCNLVCRLLLEKKND